MTIRKYFEDKLEAHGLWPNEVQAVMNAEVAKKESEGVKWSDPTDAYPPTLLVALEVSIWRTTRDYLRETAPLHFALPIFDEDHPAHKIVTGKA